MNHVALLNVLLLASAALAQQASSPNARLATEGDSYYQTLCGYYAGMNSYYTHVDNTITVSGAHAFKKLHMRRDGTVPDSSDYVARTAPFIVRMAHADYAKVVNGAPVADATLRKGLWQTVFAEKPVNLPSFVTKPATTPAPWSIAIVLDAPFAYNGDDALAIGMRIGPAGTLQNKPYPFDSHGKVSTSSATGTKLGLGCLTGSGRFTLTPQLQSYGDAGSPAYLQLSVDYGKPSAPLTVLLGTSNPALAFGGCELLYTSGQIVFSPGVTSSGGTFANYVELKHSNALVGASFWLQAAQPDGGQPAVPVALSNGSKLVYPANPSLPQVASEHRWTVGSSFPTSYQLSKGTSLVLAVSW